MDDKKWVSREEARTLVGQKIFGDDWIGQLTKTEQNLISEHGPRAEPLLYQDGRPLLGSDGRPRKLDVVRRVPAEISKRLDAALGRELRRRAQENVALDNIARLGFSTTASHYDLHALSARLEQAYADDPSLVAPHVRRRGRKAKLGPKIRTAMQAEIQALKMTPDDLAKMSDKDLRNRFGGGRTMARESREAVLASLRNGGN